MIISKSLIDHLEHEINIGNVDKKVQNLILIISEENQKLKKQLNDYKNRYTNRLNSQLAENIEPDEEDFYLSEIEIKANYYDKLVSKQKDFVEYLEDEIEALEFCDNEFILSNHKKEIKAYKKILSKHKELVGGK